MLLDPGGNDPARANSRPGDARGPPRTARHASASWALRPHRALPGRARAWLTADAHPVDTGAPHPAGDRRPDRRGGRQRRRRRATSCRPPSPPPRRVAAGVLLFDEHDRVLLVDPTYKPGWEFPGGVVEPGEAPARARACARSPRRPASELGRTCPGLLVVDWEPPGAPGLRRPAAPLRRRPARRRRRRPASCCRDPNCAPGASSPRRRRPTCCRPCATSGCAGRCEPVSTGRALPGGRRPAKPEPAAPARTSLLRRAGSAAGAGRPERRAPDRTS